jgi:hypothetical protein
MIETALASNGSGMEGLASFGPWLLAGLIFALILRSIAKRKGRSQLLWFLAGFVPGWNLLGGIWLASLTDKAIMEEIRSLADELQKFDLYPKETQTESLGGLGRNTH